MNKDYFLFKRYFFSFFCHITFFISSLKVTTNTTKPKLMPLQLELVEQCKLNNRIAQMQLYKQYCDGMFCVAMRFLKNSDDAEDVIQESFIKAFQRINQFKGEVTFGAWLKRIVVNKSIDFLKSKHQKTVELDEGFMDIVEDENWEVKEGIGVEIVQEVINELPDKYRYVVQLFLVEGYDHSEISSILAITETASRTRLLRGKKHVKESLIKLNYGTRS